MEGIGERNDLVATGGSAEFPSQLVETLVRLGAAVAEKNLPSQTDQIDDKLREFTLRPCEVEIGGVNQAGGLLSDRLGELFGSHYVSCGCTSYLKSCTNSEQGEDQ
jgi:hypothetical protein